MTFLLSLGLHKGQKKLDENLMWFKKLSLLNLNEEVATAPACFLKSFESALREKAVLLAGK